MSDQKSVEIPCTDDQLERFKHYLEKYGMTMKPQKKRSDYRTVYYENPLDLYWLGCNMAMHPFDNGIAKHV